MAPSGLCPQRARSQTGTRTADRTGARALGKVRSAVHGRSQQRLLLPTYEVNLDTRLQLRGDLSTIGHRPNRVALPEKLNLLQLNLLQLLKSFVEFPAGAGELRLQPCD